MKEEISEANNLIGTEDESVKDAIKWVDAEIERYKEYLKEDSGYNYAIIALKDVKQYIFSEWKNPVSKGVDLKVLAARFDKLLDETSPEEFEQWVNEFKAKHPKEFEIKGEGNTTEQGGECIRWVKCEDENPDKETREMYVTLIKQNKDGKASIKPAYSEWFFGKWQTEDDYTVIQWLDEFQTKGKEELKEAVEFGNWLNEFYVPDDLTDEWVLFDTNYKFTTEKLYEEFLIYKQSKL